MRTLLALSLLLPLPARAGDLDSWCTWTQARWEHPAQLLFVGTDVPFARVDAGHGVNVDGALGADPSTGVRFRVDLKGGGLLVKADVDPNREELFSLEDGTAPLGGAAIVVKGGRLAVVGPWPGGGVQVTPTADAVDTVWDPNATAPLPCGRLMLHWRPAPTEAQMLAAIGVPRDAPYSVLPRHRSAGLHAKPHGPLIAVIQPQPFPRTLVVSEERDGWSFVALPHASGTVWQGWVKSKKLRDLDLDDEGDAVIGGLATDDEPRTVRRCYADVPLHARSGAWTARIGTVAAETPFEVVFEEPSWWVVSFPGGWIHPDENGELIVPADPRGCEVEEWTGPQDEPGDESLPEEPGDDEPDPGGLPDELPDDLE